MIAAGHYGAEDIGKKIEQTKARWQGLKEKMGARQKELEEALQAQQYYSSAQEVESWMKEKEPIVSNGDYGKDEDSAQVKGSGFSVCVYGGVDDLQLSLHHLFIYTQ